MTLLKLISAALACALLVTPSLAAPLAPGKPAGVQQAAISAPFLPFVIIGGFAALAGLIATTVGNGGNDGLLPPTATATGTP